ncbi:hypothetical protein ADUPG1_001425 [Aduncisulcus paluster]|uniref:Uncharacterized protein n=2 Tax=Aduncisulcus paluster TaxID=2918883 RepID=A0ABQ5KH17_9EUKA|nr:hypothetical protein ADUPG1_001425 [Aduncisulcus paluster]
MSILTLFQGGYPFVKESILRGIADSLIFLRKLVSLVSKNTPQLTKSRLFKSLQTIEGGKYIPVYSCLNEVFVGLTVLDLDKRMSVKEARQKVQSIKCYLPKIGEGCVFSSTDDVIKSLGKTHNKAI